MRISDWSSDVCSSDLPTRRRGRSPCRRRVGRCRPWPSRCCRQRPSPSAFRRRPEWRRERSEEHTSELQSLMRISYAVFCLKKKKKQNIKHCIIHTKNNALHYKILKNNNVQLTTTH